MKVLKVSGLTKSYRTGFFKRRQQVLFGVDFEVEEGRVVGFLGRNGAGKTTTIKCLLEMAFKDSGNVEFFGSKHLTFDVKNRIGFLPERPYFYDYLTGVEFLQFYARLSRIKYTSALARHIDELLERVDLTHAKNRPLRSYSKGMLQRVGIAQALIHNPDFVLLDEPMSGLDPDGRLKINQIIKEIGQSGKTVLFSSHLLNDMERLCQDLLVVNAGRTVFQGTTEALLGQLQQGYQIVYRLAGKQHVEKSPTVESVQTRLDQLRGQKAEIREVEVMKPTLEEAFMKIAPMVSAP